MILSGNNCIICQKIIYNRKITRHHIFPVCIATNIRPIYGQKVRDIVSLCETCHNEYERYAVDLKLQILREMNFDPERRYYYVLNRKSIVKAKKACHLLFYHKDKIPQDSVQHIESIVKNYFKHNEISNTILLHGLGLKALNKIELSIGKIIASGLKTKEDIEAMVERWRNHFFLTIREMKKKFEPSETIARNFQPCWT